MPPGTLAVVSQPATTPGPDNHPVLLYDRDCGFCRWSMAKILAWDRRRGIRPQVLQSDEANRLLQGMDPDRKMASWHLVLPNGQILSAGAAVPTLLRMLPGGRPLAGVAATLPGTTERAYRFVARHRDRLGRLLGEQACAIEPGRARDRAG